MNCYKIFIANSFTVIYITVLEILHFLKTYEIRLICSFSNYEEGILCNNIIIWKQSYKTVRKLAHY